MSQDSLMLAFFLKMTVLPASGFILWLWWDWLRDRRHRARPPGEVAELLLRSLAEHPEQWRPDGAGCLAWSVAPEQPAPVKLYYTTDPPQAHIEGLFTAKFSNLDQTRIVAVIQTLEKLPTATVQLPAELGEIARQVIQSLVEEPENWHQFDNVFICFSSKPITHLGQSTARVWIQCGPDALHFSGNDQNGDVSYNFSSLERKHVWAAYQQWHKAHKDSIAARNTRQARKILAQHKVAAGDGK